VFGNTEVKVRLFNPIPDKLIAVPPKRLMKVVPR